MTEDLREPPRGSNQSANNRLAPARAVGHCTCGTAATFDEARADFDAAWRVFLSKRTEVDFQEWRDQRDWTARKYAMWEAGERVAVAAADQHHALRLWRVVRQPPARGDCVAVH